MRYLIRRIGFYLVALWASVSLNFVIPRLMPGDPAEAFLARLQGAHPITNQQLEALRVEFGVSSTIPVWQQYFTYLNNLLHGDLGLSSTNYPDNAWTIIAQHLPWTIGLLGDGYDASSGIVPGLSMDFIGSVVQHGILPAVTLVIGSTLLQVLFGTTSAYFGGFIDDILSLIINVFLVLPGLPLAIVLASFSPIKGSVLLGGQWWRFVPPGLDELANPRLRREKPVRSVRDLLAFTPTTIAQQKEEKVTQ